MRTNVGHHDAAILAVVPVDTSARHLMVSPCCREDQLPHCGPRSRERLVRPMVLAGAAK
ncbi:MAG: hypothetical protein ACYDEH_04090 [Acidimicrobiales bacterium]